MRILSIHFKNINSLKDEHRIDLSAGPLKEAGLFAITGPTGSGKSSILDAITLAIFNRIPRLEKAISKTDITDKGVIVTRNCSEAYSQVEYESNGAVYRSKWFISKNRKNNWNDYEMELSQLDPQTGEGKILEQKKGNIPDRNVELIGLTYEQFIRSMLLSQGEFSRFLQSGPNERYKLLEQLTGTHIYRQIGIQAFNKTRDIKAQIDLKKAELLGIELRDKEWLDQKTTELDGIEKLIRRTEFKWQKRLSLKKIKDDLELVKNRIKKNEEDLLLQQSQREEFKVRENALKDHEKLVSFASAINSLTEQVQQKEKLKLLVAELIERKKNAQLKKSELSALASTVVGKVIEDENFSQEINTFRNSILEMEKGILLAKQGIGSIEKNINELVRSSRVSIPKQFLSDEERISSLIGTDEKIRSEIAALDINDEEKLAAETILIEKEQKLLGLEELNREIAKRSELLISSEDATNKEKELTVKTKELSDASNLLEAQILLKKELVHILREKLQLERLKAELNEHRAHLVDGEPCPLCGSLDHPLATEVKTDEGLSAEISQEEALLKKLETEHQKTNTQKNKIEGELSQLAEQIKKTRENIELIEKKVSILTDKLELTSSEHSTVTGEEERVKKEIGALKAYIKLNNELQAIEALLEKFRERQAENKKLMELLQEKTSRYKDDDINEKISSWEKDFTYYRSVTDSAEKDILARENELKILEERSELHRIELLGKIHRSGFENIETARKKILTQETAEAYRKEKERIDNSLSSLNGIKSSLLHQYSELVLKDNPRIRIEILEESIVALEESAGTLRTQKGSVSSEIRFEQESQARYEQIRKDVAMMEKDSWKWIMISDLIGDAQGNNFCKIVQRLTLKQLFMHANSRLSELTDRYCLIANDDSKEDIEVIDLYMANLRRTVKSLSGGETFMVSLALALGLSDLASQNVRLESLFIDEGFGTLDPETLDVAISTLEKLQMESNKSIGIISHVESLKERIGCQIRLSRNGAGYSTMVVKN